MTFKVKNKKCNQCLFSPSKIVSSARKKQLLSDIAKKDSYFNCHKTDNACCRGFYDSRTSNMIRITQRLNAVEFVD